MHRGDDVRTVGLHADVGASANRSGSVSPAMSAARIARPLTPRMSVSTHVSFTFASSSVFCRRCVCRAISPNQLLAGSRQVAQFLDRSRRHEAAPNQPVRQQVGDPDAARPRAGNPTGRRHFGIASGPCYVFGRRRLQPKCAHLLPCSS